MEFYEFLESLQTQTIFVINSNDLCEFYGTPADCYKKRADLWHYIVVKNHIGLDYIIVQIKEK